MRSEAILTCTAVDTIKATQQGAEPAQYGCRLCTWTELFMCGGDAALCQIIMTMHLLTWQSSRTQRRDNVISLIYVYSSIVALHYPWSLGLLL